MRKPYGLCADLHCHAWSAFAGTTPDGLNDRLQGLLSELKRCAVEVKKAGGDTLIAAGDIFHQRGSIAPLVLNPTIDCFREIIESGIKVVLLAGNHDAELKNVTRLSSAITSLEGVGCKVINSPEGYGEGLGDKYLIPWFDDLEELKGHIEGLEFMAGRSSIDLILHAPINGVFSGIPSTGLEPEWLRDQGFRNVLSGHYHHHIKLAEGVYSIGALAAHTWSDVGSKAGFLIVGEDGTPKWFKSHLPEFIDIHKDTPPEDVELIVDGNYCRAKIDSSKMKEVEKLRGWLTECGAKGVIIQSVKEPTKMRETSIVTAGESLERSVSGYVKTMPVPETIDRAKLDALCANILIEAESA